ncbi:DUF523 domain-containing protein [Enterococcus saccharolyticus]|uniref:DUF523 domain-containing protein n=1 Tax=Candidatus Enterococcus willemsii TaxID=1857215 RepID=A0ABQ6YYN1_9ENTE|nr:MULTISPECIES: DUF523 domain-containing protein [Enterococcus]KAF1303276.1 hypothetical protein BAU17_08600 [Enterococcus sp. CU12B]MCD5001758.1 DUF523 domain-containing protein [Enterococcus saccharolyticus]
MIGISACLGGSCCRYDGKNQEIPQLRKMLEMNEAIQVCPEVLGGLPIPRDPAEIIGGDGFDVWRGTAVVRTNRGEDVTDMFKAGAKRAYEILKANQVTSLVLKDKSPSCGSQLIYDGTFSGTQIVGVGVATAYFIMQGISVQSDTQWRKSKETDN